jgi:hypothetical protein
MARIRSIKPQLRTSLTAAEWPRDVRYFWVLLWGYLDDYGRGVDDARLVKADCFPLDDDVTAATVDAWLNVLAGANSLCRYSVDGRRFMHAPMWFKHQRPSHPTDSTIPPCPHQHRDDGSREGFANPSGAAPRHSAEGSESGSPDGNQGFEAQATVHHANGAQMSISAGQTFANFSGDAPEGFVPEVEVEKGDGEGDVNPSSSETDATDATASRGDESTDDDTKVDRNTGRTDVDALCQRLAELVIANGCKPPKISKVWKDAARLMLDRDHREFDKAMRLIEWSQANEFWRTNIQSMPTFREKYDRLRLQANTEWERNQGGTVVPFRPRQSVTDQRVAEVALAVAAVEAEIYGGIRA